MRIVIKRIYNEPRGNHGFRIHVDRLWPRGLSKDKAKVDLWLKEIAPSNELRKWFAHDPEKWEEFKRRYFEELCDKKESIDLIIRKAQKEKLSSFTVQNLRNSIMLSPSKNILRGGYSP